MSTMILDGEEVEMNPEQREELRAAQEALTAPAPAFMQPFTVGDLIARFAIPEEEDAFAELDERMRTSSLLVRRQWSSDRTEIVEGNGFHAVLSGHLDGLVTPERKAELLARPGGGAAMAEEAVPA